ncbi:MAG TPA: hypothetical protein VFM96_13855 [Gaiellaceae bacterium]|nr:hypothetical protein [Gaiellaceae bacterium]
MAITGQPATIVVVDEQAALLDLVEQALVGEGHRVLVTTDPHELLELAIRLHIDAVIADGPLLERADPTLARKLELAQHGLRIIPFSSFRAPFSLDALVDEVERVLATDSPPDRLRAAPTG